MKNNPIAWLITHDAYIDRRILFFADVLLENGYSVKLFPSAYTDFTNDHDPDYVVRPLDWTVVKLYGLPVSALLEGELASNVLAALRDQDLPKLAAEIAPDWDLPTEAVQSGLETLRSHLELVQDDAALLYEMT